MSQPTPGARRPGPRWAVWALLAVAVAGGGVALLDGALFPALETRGERIRLVALALMLCALLPALFLGRLSRDLRNILVWAALFGVLATGYTLWQRTMYGAAPMAERAADGAPATGTATVRANRRGEYVVRGRVNGAPVTFLVDTGASDVVLTRRDAQRIGFDLDRLRFVQRYRTANGTIFGAPVRLGEVAIGGVRMADVRGSVADSDLGASLLGMSFINRLSAFELGGGILTLRR